ncbi:glycosyltransferase [Luteimonas sp. A537]
MSGPLRDVLLVSCPNAGGGLLLLEGEGVERLSRVPTTGICAVPGGFLWARQSGDSNVLRRAVDGGLSGTLLAEDVLDLHDVAWHGGQAYVVATERNAVLRLDDDLRETRRWALRGERDSAHLNSICFHDGRLLASRFGRFDTHRGYKGATAGAGEVFDVDSGEVLLGGLSQPHSLTSHEGALWLCDSEARRVVCWRGPGEPLRTVALDGYARGLAFGRERIYVGLSRSRNAPDPALARARIVVLEQASLAVLGTIELPADEVYDIAIVEGGSDPLRRSALAEADAELAAMEQQREAVDAVVAERDARLSGLAARLAEASDAHAAAQAHVVDLLDREEEKAFRLEGLEADSVAQAHWADLLETEAVRLRQGVDALEAALGAQSRLLQAWQGALDAVRASRSWRLTRPLRRLATLLGRPGEGEDPPRALALPAPVDRAQPTRAGLPIHGLRFEEHDAPLASIVVTAHGGFAMTLACLRSIRRYAGDIAVEVVLIEDASGEAEMARFRGVPGLRYIENASNLGFLRSANQALSLARGEYIHFLNNDTVVGAGWLAALLQTFARFHDCGLAGSRLVYPDGRLQEAGGVVWNDGRALNYGRDGDPAHPDHAFVREVDYVSGASMLVRSDLFRHLGGFDERYAPAYYEDTDLAFRIRAEGGRKVYYQPASVVHHVEGASHGTDIDAAGKASQEANRAVFAARWKDVLAQGQLPAGAHLFLARERAQLKPVVLVVDRTPPRTDRDAGSRAIWQLMRVLGLHGMLVKFWAEESDATGVYAANLAAHGIELASDGGGDLDAWMAANGAYLDLVVLSRPLVAERHVDAVRRHSAAKLLFYGHDIHHLRYVSQMRVDPDPDLAGFAHHAREVEESLWRRADLVAYPSEAESRHAGQWMREHDAPGQAVAVPLFAYEGLPGQVGEGLSERRNILFVGGFAHAPNEDGVLWFERYVWPAIHRQHPDYRLCLVGADPPDTVVALSRSDVLVTGHIPEHELANYYRSARLVVAPLRFGAGVKGKVLEAMRHGVPCVTTSAGAQGLEAADCLRVADDPATFAAMVDALIIDDTAWMAAARGGVEFLARHFSVDTVWRALSPVIDGAGHADVAARLAAIDAARSRPAAGTVG